MTVCDDCGYPFEAECRNPACVRVNPAAFAKHQAEAEKRRQEQEERDRIRAWARRNGWAAQ